MSVAFRRVGIILLLIGLAVGPVFSQGTGASSGFGFKMALGLGVQTFNEPDVYNAGSLTTTYQSIGLTPDFSFGNFGIGLQIAIDYRFAGPGSSLQIRRGDWIPQATVGGVLVDDVTFQSIMALYLPKIAYVRWGEKGDPLFLKLGSFNDATLGDGFIVGDYNNSLFLPGERHFGFQGDLDGNLFKFPYVGAETFIGNVAQMDVLGGRIYVRPLVSLSIPILSNLAVGFTAAVDTKPYFNTVSAATPIAGAPAIASPVGVFGGDVQLPIVSVKDVVSLVSFADVATIQGKSWGGMMGVGGRLINIFTYGAQIRLLGPNFIPMYFSSTYDLTRDQQYAIASSAKELTPTLVGWQASIGTSFLGDKIVFNVSLDGPFVTGLVTDPTLPGYLLSYPHLRGILSLAEGVVPGITFDFSYDKKGIAKWADLISAQDAAIQAQINFKSGPAVISFVYKIVYDQSIVPPGNPWNVTSGLQTSIALF
jgi:hypothetical protein